MNLQTKSVSAIYALPAVYSDPFFAFKQRRINYDDGLSLIEIAALSNVCNSSINNYTSHYLTDKQTSRDFLRTFKQESPLYTITTPLIFNSLVVGASSCMVIESTFTDIAATGEFSAGVSVKSLSSTAFDNRVKFELEFIDNKLLRVKHNTGSKNFFLNYIQQTDNLTFFSYVSNIDPRSINGVERNDVFRYQLDTKGYLTLYKVISDETVRVLVYENDSLKFTSVDDLSANKNSSIIYINYNYTLVDTKNSTSWISYIPNKLNNLILDNTKSRYDLPSQYLLHTNYNLENSDYFNLNFITLNNYRTEKGYVNTGTNFLSADKNIPDVDFRDYTSIYTGNNQEKGNKNMTLNYVFFNKDLVIKQGTDTFFKTPDNMYPFDKININDTDFISNGSCGGPSPLVSDKMYLNRRHTTQFNNGRYLCTWLSAGSNNSPGIWLDRYYNDSNTSTPIIDLTSSLALEPSTSYKYERIGVDDINNLVSSSRPLLSGFNNYYDLDNIEYAYNSNTLTYNGLLYNKYIVSPEVNKAGQFTVSFDLYIDQNTDYGFQIAGNKTNTGFGVRSDTIITPFIYTYQDNILYVYNSDHIYISSTKFDKDIRDIIPGKALENFFVICNSGYVYKVDPLGNKIKLEIVDNLTAYKSYLQEENTITFLVNENVAGGVEGTCIELDKLTLVATTVASERWISFKDNSKEIAPGPYEALSIFKYDNKLYNTSGRKIRYNGRNSDIIYFSASDKLINKLNLQPGGDSKQFVKVSNILSASDITITDFNVDKNNNVYVGYKNKILIYGQNRQSVASVSLSSISNALSSENIKILDIDFIKEYRFGEPIFYTSALILTEDKKLGLAKFNIYDTAFSNTFTLLPLTGTYIPFSPEIKRFTQTNYQYLDLSYIPESIKFELTLTNYLSSEEIVNKVINFDTNTIDEGFHNFSYRFDSIKGNITLFVDGIKHTNLQVPPGKYKYQTIFHEEFFLGTLGFFNGIDLATYLKQPGQYFIKDTIIRNFLFFDKVLNDTEIYAINMFGKAIDELVLSIPAGQRNNTEEIERLFRFSQTSSSKVIDINIKNLKVEDTDFRQNIINDILSQARSLLPAGVYINNINFIDFK